MMNKGFILLEYIQNRKNVADMFMKPMTKMKLNTFIKIIVDIQSSLSKLGILAQTTGAGEYIDCISAVE